MDSQPKHCRKCLRDRPRDKFSKCRVTPDGLQFWCKVCIKAYQNRPDQVARTRDRTWWYRQFHPEQVKAYVALRKAIKSGLVTRQPCEVCDGTEYVDGHHKDYSKPLDVNWLCRKHHMQVEAT